MPLLIAHRGASHAAPENTLAAFDLAWKEGADGIEGDFRLTADGRVACIHDEDTKRVAKPNRRVAASTWEELSTIDVGSWKSTDFAGERIPLLGDILERVRYSSYGWEWGTPFDFLWTVPLVLMALAVSI